MKYKILNMLAAAAVALVAAACTVPAVGDEDLEDLIIWENDGSHGRINWSGEYLFSSEGGATGEELYAIPQEKWDKMKSGSFYLEATIDADGFILRITTGGWEISWTGQDIFKGDERIIVSDDGTAFKLEINFTGDPILDYLDAHHLMFNGDGYTPQRLYLAE